MSQTENANALSPATERSLAAQIKIYYDLFVPPERSAQEPLPLLIALHGYGGSKRQMMREARLVAPEGFAIASLQGPHQHLKDPKEKGGPLRYGFGWLTNFYPEESVTLHQRALLDLIDSLLEERLADPQRLFLLGFSQSCALNYRFAFTHAERLRGVVGICGGLPGDWESNATYTTTKASVLHLYGTRDEFYSPERTRDYLERLRTRAREVEVRGYDAGHEISSAMRQDIRAWLKSQGKD
jgi:phospholipase/carboxylesterase